MKWDCDKRREDRNEKWNRAQIKPRKIFALFPVKIRAGVCVWFEYYYIIAKEGRWVYDGVYFAPRFFIDNPKYMRLNRIFWAYDRLTAEEYDERFGYLGTEYGYDK